MSTPLATPAHADLSALLAQAQALLAAALPLAVGLGDLPGIELPPPVVADAETGQLGLVATLYLGAELEVAGLVPAAEDLVRLAGPGLPGVDLGGAAGLIHRFRRGRNERASAAERRGYYAALFGTPFAIGDASRPVNQGFEGLMIDLCEALYKLDLDATNRVWGGVSQQTRVRSAARRLLDNLRRHTGPMTLFMADEIVSTVNQALAILRHRAVQAAFGARDTWGLVAAVDRQMQRRHRPHDLHLRRGGSGMIVLAWLAEAAPDLGTIGQPLLALDHPVIRAAVDWLEASLGLSDMPTAAAASLPPAFQIAG